jgi:hypothetical protein
MGQATTTKRLNRRQLQQHLGAETMTLQGERDSDEEKTVTVPSMSDQDIQAALDSYTFDDDFGRPAGEVQLRNARTKARAVLGGTDTFTNQEMQRAVARLILRELNEE